MLKILECVGNTHSGNISCTSTNLPKTFCCRHIWPHLAYLQSPTCPSSSWTSPALQEPPTWDWHPHPPWGRRVTSIEKFHSHFLVSSYRPQWDKGLAATKLLSLWKLSDSGFPNVQSPGQQQGRGTKVNLRRGDARSPGALVRCKVCVPQWLLIRQCPK